MPEPELKDKVEELINDHEVLLFMKGTPEAPQCGFSMRVVGVLDSMGVEYAALDVLPALRAAAPGDRGDLRLAAPSPSSTSRASWWAAPTSSRRWPSRASSRELLGAEQPAEVPPSAKQELQADPQQSPPMQIKPS